MPTHPPRMTRDAIASVDDLDLALGELSHLQAVEDAAKAAHELELARLTEAHKKSLVSRGVPIADRRQALETMVTEYMATHRAEVITEGKSRKLTYGTVGYRDSVPTVVPCPGRTEKSVLEKITKTILPRLVTYLKGLGLGFGLGINDKVFRTKLEINKPGIKQALADKEITLEQLAKHGLTVSESTEELYIEPRKTRLESHTKAA